MSGEEKGNKAEKPCEAQPAPEKTGGERNAPPEGAAPANATQPGNSAPGSAPGSQTQKREERAEDEGRKLNAGKPETAWGRVRWLMSNERTGMVQFVKYAIVGGFTTLLNVTIFMILAITCLKCLTEAESSKTFLGISFDFPHVGADYPNWLRAFKSVVASAIGFGLSNILCWLLDRCFVFKPGRHKIWRELLFFVSVAGAAWASGSLIQWILIRYADSPTLPAFAANIVTAVLMNFLMRKFFVFKR